MHQSSWRCPALVALLLAGCAGEAGRGMRPRDTSRTHEVVTGAPDVEAADISGTPEVVPGAGDAEAPDAAGPCAQGPAGASCDDGDPCTEQDRCRVRAHGQIACAGDPVRVDDGNPCTADRCDATGEIHHAPLHFDKCVSAAPCPRVGACEAGHCIPASPCDCEGGCPALTLPCLLAVCDDGVCAEFARDDGTACDDIDACTVGDTCIGGTCSGTRRECDDGRFCNGPEGCDSDAGCLAGTPPQIDDGVACTADRCDEALGRIVHTPDDAHCDNGLFCDGAERCDQALGCAAGTAPPVDDGVTCTADRCDEARDIVAHDVVHGSCDDGLFCNGLERCDPHRGCVGGAPPVVDDQVACTTDVCDDDQEAVLHIPVHDACDDGLLCTGSERCDTALGCRAGTPPVVDDNVACTVDRCDEVSGLPVHTPDHAMCDNGAFCDGAEWCDAALGCVAGTSPPVDDNVGCTRDRCDEDRDLVVHVPEDRGCDNGIFCDGAERCDPAQGCIAGDPPTVDDGLDCTIDRCDEARDRIDHRPNHAACDDGVFCNGPERCELGDGCRSVGLAIDDGVGCTRDLCDEAHDLVQHVADDATCDNGLFCDGAEWCDPKTGCQAGPAPTLDDNVGCTRDACDEAHDRVTHLADDSTCDNGNFCDGPERCDPAAGCRGGQSPTVDDNVACTTDWCDELMDAVHHVPDDGACDDGDYCTGPETCDIVSDCVQGTPPVLDDNVGCTVDACDEEADRVTHVPDHGACDNHLFCDGSEVCDPTTGCAPGSPPPLDDGDACTTDRCDEDADEVVHEPRLDLCDDGDDCTTDACLPDGGCVHVDTCTYAWVNTGRHSGVPMLTGCCTELRSHAAACGPDILGERVFVGGGPTIEAKGIGNSDGDIPPAGRGYQGFIRVTLAGPELVWRGGAGCGCDTVVTVDATVWACQRF